MHQINVYISHNSRFCFTRNYKKEMIRNLFNISPSVMEKSRNIIFIIHLVCRYVLSTINSFICFTTTSKHFNIYFFLLRHFSYNQLFYFFVKLRLFFFCIPSYISLQILNSYCRSLKKIKIKKKRKTKANKTTQNKTKQKTTTTKNKKQKTNKAKQKERKNQNSKQETERKNSLILG